MKFRTYACMCVALLTTLMLSGKEYFVALNGSDSNPGSLERPFASIQHAVSLLKAGDVCNVRGGRYHEAVQIDDLNGRADQPVTIQSYYNEKVILDGSVPIKTQWSRHEGQIFKTTLDQDIWQLFVNDETMISARWPNANWKDGSIWDMEKTWGHQYDESTYGHFINDPVFQDLAGTGIDFTNAIVMMNIGAWITYAAKVISHGKGSDSFTYQRDLWDRLENEVYWAHRALETGWYFFEGTLDMLDTAGEWAYQSDSRQLYFWPYENNFPENLEIRGKTLSYALQIKNSQHVTVKGLDFFASSFFIENSHHVTVEDGNLKYPSYSKRMLGITDRPEVTLINGGSQNTIRNCSFACTDGEGLEVIGEKHLIENCYFREINYSCIGSAVTVDLDEAEGTIFRCNTMHTGGASVGLRVGPASIVEYNNIYDIGHLQTDGALIQMSGPAQVGTVIRYNWLHESVKANRFDDDPKFGLRFDGSFTGYLLGERDLPHSGTVHHNVIWNTRGVFVKGDSHKVYNNLSFDNYRNDLAVRSGAGQGNSKDPLKEYDYPGWGPGMYHPDENDNSIIRNNMAGQISSNLVTQSNGLPGKNSNNWTGDVRIPLRDPDCLDFRQVPWSNLIDAGYYIEGFTENYVGKAPDIGPYETGAEHYWIPGYKSVQASTPIPPDGAMDVRADSDLKWLEGYRSIGHEVYFGTSWKAVNEADSNSPEYKGNVRHNILKLIMPELELRKTYYWRVDVLLESGEKIKGKVWSFTVSRENLPVLFT